jgi:DNA polymerase-3 subunit gamma/tau
MPAFRTRYRPIKVFARRKGRYSRAMTETGLIPNAPYRVLARKYRPQNFDDLIGQEPMVRTLTNAFRTGRIAQAYMLTGVRGVGKTTTARILARALNYRKDGVDQPNIDVREEGEHCRAILEGRHVDVIEMDAASHTGIDNMRDILDSVRYAPAIARYKVYIIDEVHQLSSHSFNALLKTLEEPPPHLKFIFATTEIRKVPVTVLSRCQRFDLRRIDADIMTAHLKKIGDAEGVEAEEEALALIARAAEGSVRDALSIFDQAIAHSAGRVDVQGVRAMLGLADRARVVDLFERVMAGDIAAALGEMKEQYDIGASPSVVLTDLADFVHFVTRLKYVPEAARDRSLTETERVRGADLAARLSVRALDRAWKILLKGIPEVDGSERPLAAAEMVLVRLTHAATLPMPEDLLRMIAGQGQETSAGATGGVPASALPAAPASSVQRADASAMEMRSPPGEGALRMQATQGSPSGVARSVAEPSPQAAAPALEIGRFEDLVLLAEQKREIRLKTMLRTNVRLVSFRDGRMEFNLAGNPPQTFVSDLGQKLFQWTGKRWTITVSREGGAPTLDEVEKAELGQRSEMARADPVVEAVLSRFPGSRIVDVKMREELAQPSGEGLNNAEAGEEDSD